MALVRMASALVHILEGFDWVIRRSSRFSYCCAQLMLWLTSVSNPRAMLMLLGAGTVLFTDSFVPRCHQFGGGRLWTSSV
jgi:hypothetical protein